MTPPAAAPFAVHAWGFDGEIHRRGGMSTGCGRQTTVDGQFRPAQQLQDMGYRLCYRAGCFPNGLPQQYRAAA